MSEIQCSFCGKVEGMVKRMMTVDATAVICNECIRVSRAVLSVENPDKVIPFPNIQRIG